MVSFILPVHPLTKRMLLCEYGTEPIVFPSHDYASKILKTAPRRATTQARGDKLTCTLHLFVDIEIARHLSEHATMVGLNFLAYHQNLLCRFGDAGFHLTGRGGVKPAIERFLTIYDVSEDEYSSETAYKLWQRFSWSLQKKNGLFFAHSRAKSAAAMGEKIQTSPARFPARKNPAPLPDMNKVVESLAAFLSEYQSVFKTAHLCVGRLARVWLYTRAARTSCRASAIALNISRRKAQYAVEATERRMRANPRLAIMLYLALQRALPNEAEKAAPSPHDTPTESSTTPMRPLEGRDNPNRSYRANGFGDTTRLRVCSVN